MDQKKAGNIITRTCKNYLQKARYPVIYDQDDLSVDEDYYQNYCLGQACGNRNCHLDYTECTGEGIRLRHMDGFD
jgi:hypothetical protein